MNYSTILNNHFNYGDHVFFLLNCYDKPNLFLRCFGIIQGKEVHKNNLRYQIKLIKIFEKQSFLLTNVQDQRIRTVFHNSKRSKLKIFNILTIANKIDFDELLQKKWENSLLIVNNFFCVKTKEELEDLYTETTKITKDLISSLSNEQTKTK